MPPTISARACTVVGEQHEFATDRTLLSWSYCCSICSLTKQGTLHLACASFGAEVKLTLLLSTLSNLAIQYFMTATAAIPVCRTVPFRQHESAK